MLGSLNFIWLGFVPPQRYKYFPGIIHRKVAQGVWDWLKDYAHPAKNRNIRRRYCCKQGEPVHECGQIPVPLRVSRVD